MKPPTEDTAATAEPEIEPNSMQVKMFTYPRPPVNLPTSELAKLVRRVAMPPLPMSRPARIKKGMARSEKLSTPVAIFWAIIEKALTSRATRMVSNDEMPIEIAIGTFITNRMTKVTTSTTIGMLIRSPFHSDST